MQHFTTALVSTLVVTSSAQSDIPGGDRDEFGCIPSAGYKWCPSTKECLRPFEKTCGTPKNDTADYKSDLLSSSVKDVLSMTLFASIVLAVVF
jgi:hypothetical protein